MTSFIQQVLKELLSREKPISHYSFVLPGKRAGSFLIHELSLLLPSAVFAPKVLSIEEFAEEVAELKAADNISSLFEFYAAYKKCTPPEKTESFETFSAWAQTLLYDFNEIDRCFIDYKSFFGYLGDIQELSHWYLQQERTQLMENYLNFWHSLPRYYEQLHRQLEEKKLAYQGMVYRKASEKIEAYAEKLEQPIIFIGFNALNNAEQKIFQSLLENGKAEVFWDIDEVFLKDEQHDVSLFMRQYLKSWPYYSKNEFKKISSGFSREKDIEMIGVPRNIGQAKYVGEILSKMSADEIQQTAVVLGDESLLLPVLNSLPPNVGEVNITMGFPLKNAPVSFLISHLLKIHCSQTSGEWYYKDLNVVNNHPVVQEITRGRSGKVADKIKKENLVYISTEEFLSAIPEELKPLYRICFGNWKDDPRLALKSLQDLIYILKQGMDPQKDKLGLEFLYQHHLLLNQLQNFLLKYDCIASVKTLSVLYKDLLSSRTVDFRGRPFSGLQLMGMLESRVLDFKNVILTSVNEGVLPAGKSSNSFIPYDLKCAYKLPTYKEKDAVYSFHFYHLLQRARQVYLLYNTESSGLSAGEKSRFLLQLEMEKQEQHTIRKYNVAPYVPAVQSSLKKVEKNPAIMERLRERAAEGFSPSALSTYIRNPLDFYKQHILGLKESEEVEETVDYNTLGTVVHDTLEYFYRKWLGKEITSEMISGILSEIPAEIEKQFRKHYSQAPLKSGKNLLIFEVAKRYVHNFLQTEVRSIKNGNSIKILQVENKLKCSFEIPEIGFPIHLKGTVDRVDEFNGKMRIIDYKTGKVERSKVEVVDWEEITKDYDRYSKPFQILAYALMLNEQQPLALPIEAGIISFKNLQEGFLNFCKKDKKGNGAKKDSDITSETLESFREQLKNLILEICDPEIPFIEKEIKQQSW